MQQGWGMTAEAARGRVQVKIDLGGAVAVHRPVLAQAIREVRLQVQAARWGDVVEWSPARMRVRRRFDPA